MTTRTPKPSEDFLAGRKFEQDRIAMILSHPAAQQNHKLATAVLGCSDMSADDLKGVLDAAMYDAAKAKKDSPGSQFLAHMNSLGNPDLVNLTEEQLANQVVSHVKPNDEGGVSVN